MFLKRLASNPQFRVSAFVALVAASLLTPLVLTRSQPGAAAQPCDNGDGEVARWAFEELNPHDDTAFDTAGGTLAHDATVSIPGISFRAMPGAPLGASPAHANQFFGFYNFAAADEPCLDPGNTITLATWVRPESVSPQSLISKAITTGGGSPNDGYEIGLTGTRQVFFRINQQTSGNTFRVDSTTLYGTPIWIHVAATYDGTTMILYINGIADGSLTSSPTLAGNALPLTIGSESSGIDGLRGQMDDVRVYNRALSACEINVLAGGAPCATPTPTNTPEPPTDTPTPTNTATDTPTGTTVPTDTPTDTPTPTNTIVPTDTPTDIPTDTPTNTPTPTETPTDTPTATPTSCGLDVDCDRFDDIPATLHHGPYNLSTAVDNCPGLYNIAQDNLDGNYIDQSSASFANDLTSIMSDAQGDACDMDDDNDGLRDIDEQSGSACGGVVTLYRVADTDGDRTLDRAECSIGTNPTSALSKPTSMQCAVQAGAPGIGTDTDGDRLKDYIEYCYYGSNASSSDSDGDRELDGAKDGCEAVSFNPDRIVNVADMGMLAVAIQNPARRHVNMDINKDGFWNPADQGLLATFIGGGQCPG